MPTDQYLTEEQTVVFGRFVGEPSPAELEQFFYLDAADLEGIAERRGEHNRLGFALQVGTARFLGAASPRRAGSLPLRLLPVGAGNLQGWWTLASGAGTKFSLKRTRFFAAFMRVAALG
ncbi:hypothetical protein HD598_001740 [Neomicrococcus aestuarii]|uniref:DUF4158 domain-containing protein n=1 Tax=Neomicrococcus aestuarii TaxID=556325 RepID=A0A7W8TUK2_9MICC|nr:hypothetical protein [Neomicrococcus aestuarii]